MVRMTASLRSLRAHTSFKDTTAKARRSSSQWMQWSEDGLLIGQFGHPAQHPYSGELYPGAAANIATMATVSADNSIYLYNSDEEYHPGVHRWKISSLDSIHEVSGTTQLGNTVTLQ